MTLRVLSLNTWGLPFGLVRDLPRRTEALGRAFASSGADAIALQEVWTERARTHLRGAATEAGLEHAFFVDRSYVNAGLVVFSRHPFVRGTASQFRVRGRAERVQHGDYWAGKGWLDVVVATPEGELRLVDTHLHAAYSNGGSPEGPSAAELEADGPRALEDYAGERMAQVVELAHGLRERALPLLAVGDFNMHEGSAEYEVWRSLAGVTDVAADLDARQATIEAGHLYGVPGEPAQRIDYAFVRSGRQTRLRPLAISRDFDAPIDLGGHEGRYSDHAGLRIDFALEPRDAVGRAGGAAAASAPPDPASTAALQDAIALARARLHAAAEATRARAARQSVIGLGGLVAAGALGFAADLRTRGRRSMLRALALGVPGLGVLASGATVALGEGFTRTAARHLDDVARLLDELEPR